MVDADVLSGIGLCDIEEAITSVAAAQTIMNKMQGPYPVSVGFNIVEAPLAHANHLLVKSLALLPHNDPHANACGAFRTQCTTQRLDYLVQQIRLANSAYGRNLWNAYGSRFKPSERPDQYLLGAMITLMEPRITQRATWSRELQAIRDDQSRQEKEARDRIKGKEADLNGKGKGAENGHAHGALEVSQQDALSSESASTSYADPDLPPYCGLIGGASGQ